MDQRDITSAKPSPFDVVKLFEQELCRYTGAPYAVTTTSCTMAILLACRYMFDHATYLGDKPYARMPHKSYVGVPQSIVHAGGEVGFSELSWEGKYEIEPWDIWDCARLFTSGMYVPDTMQCVSFHWSKILGIGQGGAILHDNPKADSYLRRLRFDGRSETVPAAKDWHIILGYHAYMMPRDAAEGLSKLAVLPKHNDPLPKDDYPDLSKMRIFQC